jgi:hypothetical protein
LNRELIIGFVKGGNHLHEGLLTICRPIPSGREKIHVQLRCDLRHRNRWSFSNGHSPNPGVKNLSANVLGQNGYPLDSTMMREIVCSLNLSVLLLIWIGFRIASRISGSEGRSNTSV